MSAPAFVDTNILIYADDVANPAKRLGAQDLIRQLLHERSAHLSMQVLQEYSVVATRKLRMDPIAVRQRIEIYSQLNIVTMTPRDLIAAIDLHRLHGFSIWDTLILRAAIISGCETLYTEDLQAGFRIEKLEIVNPFASS